MTTDSPPTPVTADDFERERLERIRRARASTVPLVRDIPRCAQLTPRFDVARLQSELAELQSDSNWRPIESRGSADSAPGRGRSPGWSGLHLRTPGGLLGATATAAGPGMKAYANTAHLDHAPYVREIVDTFPAPVRGATFMSLQPGIESIRHVDAKLGFPWGAVRLHIPVVTNSSATTLIDDEEVHWDEG